jgi:hypothetical protein
VADAARITVQFFGRDRTLGKSFRDQMKAADTFGKKVELIGTRMSSMGRGLTMGVTLPIVAGLGLATKAAMDDERSQRVLAQQIRNTVDATDAEIAKVEEFINTQARATGVADDELRPAFAKLVTATGDVTKAQELMAIAQDTAAGTGRGLDSVITAMMKGTQGSVDLFARMGVATKDAEGNTLSFDEVLAGLKGKFDGLAETSADPYAKLSVAFGELAESVGVMLVPMLEGLTSKLTGLAEWLENLSPLQRKLAVGFAIAAAAAGPLLWALGTTLQVIAALSKAHILLRAKTIATVVATKVAAAAQWLWNAAMSANPIGLVIAAIVALIAIFVVLYKKNETFRKVVDKVWGAFKDAVGAIVGAVKKVIGKLGDLWGWVKDHKQYFVTAFNVMFAPIKLAIETVKTLIGWLQSAWEWIKKLDGGGASTAGGGGTQKGGHKVHPQTGGTFTGPKTGYPAVLHGDETVVAHDSPVQGLTDLAKLGFLGGSQPIVNVYVTLDSEPIAAQIEVREERRLRVASRTLGMALS